MAPPMQAQHVAVDLSTIPNLPGYGYKRRQKNYHKPQTFNYCNGMRVEQQEGVTFERPRFVKTQQAPDARRSGTSMETSTMRDEYAEPNNRSLAESQLPAWDALDRHVLRFYGFFKEAVVETNLENYRVRNCVILYYCEDDTCQVTEKRQDNSGMPQGQLIRRHRFPGANGGYLDWQDLMVGGLLHIYGRVIKLVDCDGFTREYCSHHGIEQELPEQTEDDAFSLSMKQQDPGSKSHGIPQTSERRYREVALGGGHVNEEMQQFLEMDRKVCRFYAVLDDMTTPQFERRPFCILYFLSDDTVEIREQYPLNAGRDNFPIFFRRGRLPRGKVVVRGPLDAGILKEECLDIRDFTVGQMHQLLGYNFYIYEADPFTRQYFEEALGDPLPVSKDVRLPDRTVPRPPTPPYTGFGSWDDSMASVLNLVPKQPGKDFKKLFDHDGQILRFTAQIVDAKPEDAERLFVLNFHLFDDTLSIHEPPQRNIGIVTGKFLEKNVHMNQITGELFKPADFFPGSVVKVYNREFEITDMDEYTRKYVETKEVARKYDLSAVLEKLRESMRQQFPLVRDIFRKFDTDHDGVLTAKEFQEALRKFGFQCSMAETIVIMKHFDARGDGQVSYNEFCDVLLDEDYTQSMMKTKPPLKQQTDPQYGEKVRLRMEERTETEQVRKAARDIGNVIYKHAQVFFKLFKEFATMTHEGVVTYQQIQQAMLQIGFDHDLEDVKRTVLYVIPDADLQRINYVQFLKAMTTSYHDLCANR